MVPLLFVIVNLMGKGDAFAAPATMHAVNLLSPIVFLGALLVACTLNVGAILHVNVARRDNAFVCTVRIVPGAWNLCVIAMSASLLGVLFTYAVVENFVHR